MDSAVISEDAAIALLSEDAGVWEVTGAVVPAPGAAEVPLRGLLTARMVGGRWLVTDWEAESGFCGHGVYGWDSDQGRFVATWVDNMQSALALGSGAWDDGGRAITFDLETRVGGRTVSYREVIARPDGSTRQYQNLVPQPDGTWHPVITMTYTRRPSS